MPTPRYGRSFPERPQCRLGGVVTTAHQIWPAAAVQEQVVEAEPGDLVEGDGLDQRELVAEQAARAAREFEVAGAAELAAGGGGARAALVPAGDVLALEAGRQQHVQTEDVVEPGADQRFGREGVDDAAIDVEISLYAHRLDEKRECDGYADELTEHQVWCIGRSEVLDKPFVQVVDDRV